MAKHILNKDGSTTHKFDNGQEITIAPLPPEFSTGTPQKKGLESYTYFEMDMSTCTKVIKGKICGGAFKDSKYITKREIPGEKERGTYSDSPIIENIKLENCLKCVKCGHSIKL